MKQKKVVDLVSIIILVSIFIVILVQLNNVKINDFSSYILSSKALLKNTNPYLTGSPFQYIYPLSFAFILIPFTFIPEVIAQNLWYILNLLFLFIIIKGLFDRIKIRDSQSIYLFVLILLIIILNVVQNNLRNGQVNIFILLLCTLFLSYYEKRKIYLSSLLLALAISIKMIPLIILGFCLVKKDFKIVLLTLGFVILFILVPFIIVGDNLFTYYGYYYNLATHNVFQVELNSDTNQGMFFNLVGLVNFLFPGIKIGIWLHIANGLIVFLILFVVQKYFTRKTSNRGLELVFYLYVLSTLLISPMSETHHLIFLLPVIQLIMVEFWINYSKKNFNDWILSFLIVAPFFLAKYIHYSLYFILIVACFIGYIKYVLMKPFSDSNLLTIKYDN